MPSATIVRSLMAMSAARAAGQEPDLLDRPRQRPDDFAGAALETAKNIGAGVVRPVFTGLEYMARPWASVVEAYGAYEAGRDPMKAGKRVLKKGIEKARYPTIGERLVPEEEDEGWGRVLARLGVDVATDPTMWFGPGIARGVGGIAVKGTRAAGRTKAVQTVLKSDAAQSIARGIVPLAEQLPFYGKKAGAVYGTRLKRAEVATDLVFNQEEAALIRKVKELGLAGGKNEARRKLAMNRLRRGQLTGSGDDAVDKMAQYASTRLRDTGGLVKGFTDDFGRGVEIHRKLNKNAVKVIEAYRKANKLKFKEAFDDLTERGVLMSSRGPIKGRYLGKKTYAAPFDLEPNYFPQVMKAEIRNRALTASGRSGMADELAKRLRIPKEQAEQMLKEQTGRTVRAGHIEHARRVVMPDEMLELDPLVVLPRYFHQTYRRLAMAKEFGLEGQRAEKLGNAAVKAGLSTKTNQEVLNYIRGVQTESSWDRIAPKVLGFQVLTKMGPTSTLAQFSQHGLTVVSEGLGNYVKGVTRLIADPEIRRLSGESFGSALRAQLQHLTGSAEGGALFGGRVGRWLDPRKWLRGTGFTAADSGARRVAFAAGHASAEAAAKKAVQRGAGLTDELKKMGVDEAAFRYFAQSGKLPTPTIRKVGLLASEKTQFLNRFTDLPPLWQTPSFRMAVQFKSFAYQMSRFLLRDVMSPAIRYFDTGGKAGSIAPLMRAVIALPAAGGAVAEMRELIEEQMAGAIGAKRKRKRRFDYKHPVAQMLEDSMYVGAFGIAGDAFKQAAQGNFLEFLAGPTASDLVRAGEFGAQRLQSGKPPSMEELGRYLYPHVPFRRALPLPPSEIVGAARKAIR